MARTKRKNIDELPQYSFHDIRLGDTGRAVAFTQWLLKQMGWYNGKIDGIFGQKTLMAVRKFQSAHNLTVSGIVDRPSRYALYGDAVDKNILKAMPTPYYVNNWKEKEQASETSHETTPGTGTQALNYPEDATPQTGSVIAPTAPEDSQQLPEEYQPTQLMQQPYYAPQQMPNMPPMHYPYLQQPITSSGYTPATPMGPSQPSKLPFGMEEYWNQVYQQQQQRDYLTSLYMPYRWYAYDPYPYQLF